MASSRRIFLFEKMPSTSASLPNVFKELSAKCHELFNQLFDMICNASTLITTLVRRSWGARIPSRVALDAAGRGPSKLTTYLPRFFGRRLVGGPHVELRLDPGTEYWRSRLRRRVDGNSS